MMTQDWQHFIPEPLHDAVRAALASVYGLHDVDCLGPVTGGASGAVALRMRAGTHQHLMRVEVRKSPARNPHHYTSMTIAAEAGIAPPLHHVDADNGIAVMDFIEAVPLDQFPGGKAGLARASGAMARNLQATTPFPVLADFRMIAGRLLGVAERWFAPGLLDGHRAGYDAICGALAWDEVDHVSSHNDPNPRNLLFDGARLWLIDWETAYRNDLFVDVAILADNLAATPDLKAELLGSWLGRSATADEAHRLEQITLLTRLYYAGMLFMVSGAPAEKLGDLQAPTRAEFEKQVAGNASVSPEILVTLGKMHLRGFAEGWAAMRGQNVRKRTG